MTFERQLANAWQPPTRATLIAAAAVLSLISACTPKVTPDTAPPTVLTQRVAPGTENSANTYSGEVRARIETPLSFRIPGRLVRRLVHLGDEVKKGAVLAEIDPADASATQRATEAQLRAAEHRLTLARQSNARNSTEAKEDLVSRNDLEQSEANLAIAGADVEQLRAQLELARNQSSYTHLIADQNGLITSENAEEGAVLAAGQTVFGFAQASERDVTIDVAEDRIESVKIGQSARITFPSNSDLSYTAHVREIAQAADPQSRTFRVKLAIANPEKVKPGLTATVLLAARSGQQLITIPASALFHKGNDTAVWVVEPKTQTLQLRTVEVASYRPDQVVLTRGLINGDQIVTKGVNTVTADMLVHTSPDTVKGENL